MICTPVARNPVYQYTAALASTLLFLSEQGIKVTFQFVVGGSVIHKARNELCAHFLPAISPTAVHRRRHGMVAERVLRLLASDKPLIGGVGRMRVQKPNSDPAVWCWRPLHVNGGLHQDEMGAIEVKGFGAAFMLINRRVLHDMATAHPEWKRAGATTGRRPARQLFRVLPHRRRRLRHRVRRGLRVLQSLARDGQFGLGRSDHQARPRRIVQLFRFDRGSGADRSARRREGSMSIRDLIQENAQARRQAEVPGGHASARGGQQSDVGNPPRAGRADRRACGRPALPCLLRRL
jgi:hypothetical protein